MFDVPLVIQLTDDEKFMWKDLKMDECQRLGWQNVKVLGSLAEHKSRSPDPEISKLTLRIRHLNKSQSGYKN